MISVPRRAFATLPFVFFGTLLAVRASAPEKFVFDEIHYIPAAKSLAEFGDNLNWVHPPLAKLIMGFFWLVFNQWTGLLSEPLAFRLVTIGFGLWALWGVRAWMRELGYSEFAAQCSLWLTGFNFLWFVQSKTAMLDAYFLAFGVWGLLEVYRKRSKRGWVLLGLAMAAKWAAAPFFAIALWFERAALKRAITGLAISMAAYTATFLPLAFLSKGAVGPFDLVSYHQRMLNGFGSINEAPHPYASHWWQWPSLARPMWYAFESAGGSEVCIWAGGNPALYWFGLPLTFVALVASFGRKNATARVLSLLYWAPLLFWAIAPRGLQLYYYYLPASLWTGPIVVWAHERWYGQYLRRTQRWLLIGFVLLCAALFIYFLPIMDARILPSGQYMRYMWLKSWI